MPKKFIDVLNNQKVPRRINQNYNGNNSNKQIPPKLHDFDLFVFDWDGTLTELKIIRTLDQKYGLYWFYKKLRYGKKKKHNKTHNNSIAQDKFIITRESKEHVISFFADIYLTLFKPKLHNDVGILLTMLKSRGKKIALFTNGTEWRIDKELALFRMKNMFDTVLSAQKIKIIKPDPTGLNIIIKKFKVSKKKVLYIGDMADDIIMAKAANVYSCALGNGFDNESTLKNTNPTFYFKGIKEFIEAFKSEEI
ncbi:MAG: HAD family hydrolase [Candidatus Micrarchaeia archaeon]